MLQCRWKAFCNLYRTPHVSKAMLKILQARLQQYMNQELPDVQVGFRKGTGTRDQIASICWIIEKAREFQKNIYFSFIDFAKAFDCVDHSKEWKILRDGNTRPVYLTPAKSVQFSRSVASESLQPHGRLHARLQKYMNGELPDVQAGFRKGRGWEIKLPTSIGSLKKQGSFRKTSTSALLTMPMPLTVWITTNCGNFFKRREYQTTLPASWETCTQVKKQQLVI